LHSGIPDAPSGGPVAVPAVHTLTWIAVVIVGAAIALAACGSSEPRTAQDTASPTPTGTATPTATASATGTATADEAALDRMPEVPEATTSTRPPTSANDPNGSAFLTAVFDDAQAMWKREFEAAGVRYAPARITIFRNEVHTACGTQSASVGPFYCPADSGVYLDRRFFDALSARVGVRLGDFAQAYVVAHEVAHHVQMLLGTLQRVAAEDQQDPAGENARSVRLELQADCYAGIWKHSRYARGQLRQEDFEDALRAAAVVGNDFQQQLATGTISPEDWTHGSSRQRQHWLTTGFEQGRPSACDTFGA
jgi:predicted metalloprotease